VEEDHRPGKEEEDQVEVDVEGSMLAALAEEEQGTRKCRFDRCYC